MQISLRTLDRIRATIMRTATTGRYTVPSALREWITPAGHILWQRPPQTRSLWAACTRQGGSRLVAATRACSALSSAAPTLAEPCSYSPYQSSSGRCWPTCRPPSSRPCTWRASCHRPVQINCTCPTPLPIPTAPLPLRGHRVQLSGGTSSTQPACPQSPRPSAPIFKCITPSNSVSLILFQALCAGSARGGKHVRVTHQFPDLFAGPLNRYSPSSFIVLLRNQVLGIRD